MEQTSIQGRRRRADRMPGRFWKAGPWDLLMERIGVV